MTCYTIYRNQVNEKRLNMSRQTVNLSDETTQLLKLYVNKRGVNNSSAIAGMVSDTLDEWNKSQQSSNNQALNKATNAPVEGSLDIFRVNLATQEISAIAINIAKEKGLSQTAEDISKLFIKTLETIIPDTFDETQTKKFRLIFAQYLSHSDYFKNWYINFAGLFPEMRQLFDSELAINDYPSIPELNKLIFDINNEEIVGLLIQNYWNNNKKLSMLSEKDTQTIQDFINNNKNGLILVNGEMGTGKTTLMIELAQKFHLPFKPLEITSIYNNEPLTKISNIHAKNNESTIKRLHDMTNLYNNQPENLKDDTPILLIHTKRTKDEASNTYPRVISDIEEAYY